jgi:hypothetical protein
MTATPRRPPGGRHDSPSPPGTPPGPDSRLDRRADAGAPHVPGAGPGSARGPQSTEGAPVSATDYIINAILVLLVLRQIQETRSTWVASRYRSCWSARQPPTTATSEERRRAEGPDRPALAEA